MLNRRRFALGAASLFAGAYTSRKGATAEGSTFSEELPLPRLVDAVKQGNAVGLKVASGRHAFIAGKLTRCYGYSAPVLGPVIRVRRGDAVEMTIQNALDRDTTVHWHGLLVAGDLDGGPQQVIKPGGTWRPVLKIDQPASTVWYHPHPHHDTARQTYLGLAGLLIVDDGSDAGMDLPRTYGFDDLPIILQDRSFASDGSLLYSPSPLSVAYGSRGDTIVVNGAIRPFARVPRGLVRLRILNAANARNFYLRLSDRRMFHVIASDGGFLAAPAPVRELRISPGERFEVVVDFSNGMPATLETGADLELGAFGAPSEGLGGTTEFEPVLRFAPVPRPTTGKLPACLVSPEIADPAAAARRRQFILDSSMCAPNGVTGAQHASVERPMCINGKPYDMGRIDEEVRIGTTEIWQIFSVGMAHPFHTHGAWFRILSIGGKPPSAHVAGWKDVVLVEDNAEVLVAFKRPASAQFPFMYHCHILEHAEAGMMGQYTCA